MAANEESLQSILERNPGLTREQFMVRIPDSMANALHSSGTAQVPNPLRPKTFLPHVAYLRPTPITNRWAQVHHGRDHAGAFGLVCDRGQRRAGDLEPQQLQGGTREARSLQMSPDFTGSPFYPKEISEIPVRRGRICHLQR